MSGTQVHFPCELDPSLTVTGKVDWEGDIWIGMSNTEGDKALLTSADARSLGEFLIWAADKQEAQLAKP